MNPFSLFLSLVLVIVLLRVLSPSATHRVQPMSTTAQFRLESYPAADGTPLDADALLWAIAQVESGGNHLARGNAGERGAWQFTEATWRETMPGVAWTEAHDPIVADTAAHRHLARLLDKLRRKGQPRTPATLYRLWNPGSPTADGLRVDNLYRERLAHP